MASIIIFVTNINHFDAPPGRYRIAGQAEVDGVGLEPVYWDTLVNFTDSVANVNKACVDAAVATAQAIGHTILPSDAKTLFASAV